MPEHRQHKRFTLLRKNDPLSLSICYWYVQATRITMPKGNENESKYMRPRCVHT
jgi:hypothetical protein